MGYQMSDYELRAGYIAIRTAEDMERISGKKVVATNDYLIQLKRDLREWIKRDDGEPRNVIFFDGGGRRKGQVLLCICPLFCVWSYSLQIHSA